MSKKKAIKITTATAIAASAFVAVAPTQSEAATSSVDKAITKATNQMAKAYDTYHKTAKNENKLPKTATIRKEVKLAQEYYAAATKEIAKNGGSKTKKAAFTKKLDTKKKYLNRAEAYLAAINTNLNPAKSAFNAAVETGKAKNVVKAKAALVKDVDGFKATVAKIYGPDVRNLLLEKYEAPATTLANSVNDELKVYEAYKAIEAGKFADLAKTEELINSVKTEADALKTKTTKLATTLAAVVAKNDAAFEKAKTPVVKEVKAISATQAVVTFEGEIGEANAENFTVNDVTVIKAEVNADNKKEVKLTFNKALTDKDTYKVSVNGVKSAAGTELKEAQTVEFKYEIATVNSVALSTTKFYSTENVLDSVIIKDKNGLVLDNSDLNIVLSSTDTDAVNTVKGSNYGKVSTLTTKSFFVEVKVLDTDGSELATTGAVKVTVAPELEVSAFDGIHIGDTTNVATYENAKKLNKLNTSLKVKETSKVLNLFGKDVGGNIVALTPVDAVDTTPANYKITNLTPTVANVTVEGGEFVIKPVTAGKAQAKIKVGDVETTVSFEVVANEKIADAKLSKDKVSLDSATGATKTTDTVTVSLLDQYGDDIALPSTPGLNEAKTVVTFGDTSKLTVKSSNTKAAVATVATDGTVTIDKVAKGSSTVTVEYKNAAGTVVFTKSIAVTVSEFGTETATYKLALDSTNTVLDADNDEDESGADEDDSVAFVLNKLDKNGNVIGTQALEAGDLTFTTSNVKDASFFKDVDFSVGKATIAVTDDAKYTLINSGTVKVTAKVNGGVAVDTFNIAYKNTDSVATKAVVNTANRTVDLSNLGGASVSTKELLFGKLNTAGTKYLLNPALTVQDQFAATMSFKIATGTDVLSNGLTVAPTTPVVTNLNNVSNAGGVLTLTDDSKAGTATIVVPAVSTDKNTDLLAAPVSINVTLVK